MAAPVFDSCGVSAAFTTALEVSTSFTNAAGNYLEVEVFSNGNSNVVNKVEYACVALTKIHGAFHSAGSHSKSTWYLYSPATGANNVIINSTSGITGRAMFATYSGVDTTRDLTAAGAFEVAEGTSSTPSVSQSATSTDELIIGTLASDGADIANNGADSQTQRINTVNGVRGSLVDKPYIGTDPVVPAWTLAASDQWIATAVALLGTASATGWGALLAGDRNRLVQA